MGETRKVITLKEFEEIMEANNGKKFFASSADSYGLSVDLLCGGINFDKTAEDEYLEITLCGTGTAEVGIEPEAIDNIYLNEDGTIGIEFNICVPELEIKFQEEETDSEEA